LTSLKQDGSGQNFEPGDIEAGRHVSQPSNFPRKAWWQVGKRVYLGISEHHLSIVAAGVAFFGMLAIFPAIAALIALYGLVADPNQIAQSLGAVRGVLPSDVFTLIDNQVTQLANAGRTTLGIATLISTGFALWSARAGVTALIEGLNIVYSERDERNIIVQYLGSLGLTLVMILMTIAAILAVVATPAVLQFVDLGPLGGLLARLGPPLVLGFGITFVIGAVYRYGPHRRTARVRWVSIGAIFATFGWLIVSLGLSAYVSNFADFNETYGSLGAIVAVLFWFYASAFVVLIGAEINANLELQTRRDTTSGRQRPMGQRGAYVADHVA
jgi:membrane protein